MKVASLSVRVVLDWLAGLDEPDAAMPPAAVTVAAWLFGAGGIILAGIGVFFIVLRLALLPEDLRFLGRSNSEIEQALPQLRTWLRRVFTVPGGHALAAGG